MDVFPQKSWNFVILWMASINGIDLFLQILGPNIIFFFSFIVLKYRSMPTDTALMNLVKDSSRHEEVFQLFNSTAFDFFDHEDGQVRGVRGAQFF